MNYIQITPDGINKIILSKLNYGCYPEFCTLSSNLGKDGLTWKIIIKENFPEPYKSLLAINYLGNLDILYYLYKDNMHKIRDVINLKILSFEDSDVIYNLLDGVLNTLIFSSVDTETISELICYNNYPGIYPRLKEIMNKNKSKKYISYNRWYQSPLEIIQWESVLYSLIHSARLKNLKVDEYLLTGKLGGYPTLFELFGPRTRIDDPDPYSYYNNVFLFLYTRESEVSINNEPHLDSLFYDLCYISIRLNYGIDWLVDKIDDRGIDIIYEESISNLDQYTKNKLGWGYKRGKIRNYYLMVFKLDN